MTLNAKGLVKLCRHVRQLHTSVYAVAQVAPPGSTPVLEDSTHPGHSPEHQEDATVPMASGPRHSSGVGSESTLEREGHLGLQAASSALGEGCSGERPRNSLNRVWDVSFSGRLTPSNRTMPQRSHASQQDLPICLDNRQACRLVGSPLFKHDLLVAETCRYGPYD
jgi:hypothetical protein